MRKQGSLYSLTMRYPAYCIHNLLSYSSHNSLSEPTPSLIRTHPFHSFTPTLLPSLIHTHLPHSHSHPHSFPHSYAHTFLTHTHTRTPPLSLIRTHLPHSHSHSHPNTNQPSEVADEEEPLAVMECSDGRTEVLDENLACLQLERFERVIGPDIALCSRHIFGPSPSPCLLEAFNSKFDLLRACACARLCACAYVCMRVHI